MTRAWVVLGFLVVGACSGDPAGPCRLQLQSDMDATFDHERLQVIGRINAAPVALLVDTGAERTILTTETVSSLKLPRSERTMTRLAGVGGMVTNADVFAGLDLGGTTTQSRLAVAAVPGLGGIIGADVLDGYDLELAVPDKKVRFWKRQGACTAADLPWQGARNTIPAEITEGGRILLTVQVNDRPVSALLDSGASRSLMLSDTASRLGVGAAELAGDDQTLARGVDGGAIGVRNHSFGSLQVGADRLPSPTIGVADFQLNAADMLLGLDYLQTRRVWVSYRSGTVFAQPAGTAKPP